MILQIDDLKLPSELGATAELINRDSQRQTVSGRLVTKYDAVEKWKLTLSFESIALAIEYQKAFYEKCAQMRREARPVTFISPYTGEVVTVRAKCIQRASPEAVGLYLSRPHLYRKAGAVFQEV